MLTRRPLLREPGLHPTRSEPNDGLNATANGSANDAFLWLLRSRTRNPERRWCEMKRFGNHAEVRAHRRQRNDTGTMATGRKRTDGRVAAQRSPAEPSGPPLPRSREDSALPGWVLFFVPGRATGARPMRRAWVSGFFGSGKSHLLKMLTHLWSNAEFSDGSTACCAGRLCPLTMTDPEGHLCAWRAVCSW